MLMKSIFVTGIMVCALACDQNKPSEENVAVENTPEETIPPPLSDSTVMKFSDEEVWLSNLLSDKKEVRTEAFKKYIAIRDTSRNASDLMTGYIKTYFSTYPKEFLSEYTALKSARQEKVVDDITHEFHASGDDYKVDLEQYFQGIINSCTDCSPEFKKTLNDIRQKIGKKLVKHRSA